MHISILVVNKAGNITLRLDELLQTEEYWFKYWDKILDEILILFAQTFQNQGNSYLNNCCSWKLQKRWKMIIELVKQGMSYILSLDFQSISLGLVTLVAVPTVAVTWLNRRRAPTSSDHDGEKDGGVIPESVNCFFSRQCNYSCGFCFHTAKTSFILPIDEAKRGLWLLKEAGKLIVIRSQNLLWHYAVIHVIETVDPTYGILTKFCNLTRAQYGKQYGKDLSSWLD